jgi:hypothetical protein
VKKDDLEQIRNLVGQHLLATLKVDDGKPPRASLLNACISYLKMHSDFVADVNKPDLGELRQKVEASLTDPRTGERLQLPFFPGVPGYTEADPMADEDDEDQGADESATDF